MGYLGVIAELASPAMTVRLTVDRARWRAHVDQFAASVDGLVPVAKGNGYGFGLVPLAEEAARLSTTIAVGNLHEAVTVAARLPDATILVLTPIVTGADRLPSQCVPTIGSIVDVETLASASRAGPVTLKLASSMRRYGVTPDEHEAVRDSAARAGLEITSYAIHPPLIADEYGEDDAVREIESWLSLIDPSTPLSVSHLSPPCFADLRSRHRDRELRLRVGTALWHGDKSFLRLSADVIASRRVAVGERAGYRQVVVPAAGTLVMIGAGSALGIAPLVDGRSPFHHDRRRLALLEPPHMHTSIAFVPDGDPSPCGGEWVDVQRPLITTTVDEVVWT
jgi:alanine racemase